MAPIISHTTQLLAPIISHHRTSIFYCYPYGYQLNTHTTPSQKPTMLCTPTISLMDPQSQIHGMYHHLVDLQGVNYHMDIFFHPFHEWPSQFLTLRIFSSPISRPKEFSSPISTYLLEKWDFLSNKQKIINFNFPSVSFFYFSVFLNFIKLGFCVRIYNWTNMVTSIIIYLFYDREEEQLIFI